ncbi:MAG: hypothetical protein RMK57_15355 [Bryobacterales bacterium]|nr:hypothetical protein [Bryobacterales bacterium]
MTGSDRNFRATAWRLFLTCWLIYVLHFATNTVREIFLALAIGDHFSFRVDEYAGLHPDLFEKPGYGWHINSNPGASMVAAIPYTLFRPLTDRIVKEVNGRRARSPANRPPSYHSPLAMARDFYREAWKRGFDVKFGLAAFVMQAFAMAPISAVAVVAMFWLLGRLLANERTALWLALLYAFGTPVFFRTGTLNHNLMLGHFAFLGFLALWNPGGSLALSTQWRHALAGMAGGAAVLFDYGGVVLLAGLFLYATVQRERRLSAFLAGAAGPILLLWFYQWRSFGHPFYPAQHWMPPVHWSGQGYQGLTWPHPELLVASLFDYRYGLFTSCPLLLVGLVLFLSSRGRLEVLGRRELFLIMGVSIGTWLFYGGVHYSRLQSYTGVRYLTAVLPFLYLPVSLALLRLSPRSVYFIGLLSITQAWCMAMYREVEHGYGLLEPLLHVFIGGFQLPWLVVMSRIEGLVPQYIENGFSPLPLFVFTAALLYGIWRNWKPQT